MKRSITFTAVVALLCTMPAHARWADGCGSYGNPPCSLCTELKAGAPLETQCVWGANRRTSLREYLEQRSSQVRPARRWKPGKCFWNGDSIPCKVDHTANGMGWAVKFNNGAENIYYLPEQTVRLITPAGRVSTEKVQAKNTFDEVIGAWVMRAVDQDGGVLAIVQR